MRGKMLISGATLLLVFTVASAAGALMAEDRYGERLDDLEARVTRLERLAGIPTPTEEPRAGTDGADGQAGEDGEDGEDGSISVTSGSSSSSSSSQSNVNNSYSASFSSNGDLTQEFELGNGGIYHLTAHASSDFSARVETADGDVIQELSVDLDEAGTSSVSAELQPGEYVLRVDAGSQWTVTITSVGD